MEAKVITSGKMHYIGVPFNDLSGASLKEKRATLLHMGSADLKDLIVAKGFAVTHEVGKLLIIPSGFVLSVLAPEVSFGCRWSLASDSHDTSRVRAMLTELVSNFPEFSADRVHSQFLGFLDAE